MSDPRFGPPRPTSRAPRAAPGACGGATLAPHEERGERRGADAALRQGRCPRLRAALPPPSPSLVPVPAATGRQCGYSRRIVPGPLDARRQFPRALSAPREIHLLGIRHRPQSPDGFLPRERRGVVPESRGKRIRPRGPSRRGDRRGPAPGPKARGGASARRARRASRCAARGLSPAAGERAVDRGNRRRDRGQPRDREEPPALCCGEAASQHGEETTLERRADEPSRTSRDAEGPRPPQRVDDNILAAAQRVAGTVRRRAGFGFPRRWGTPVALAATVLVTFTLALMVFERESGLDTMAPKAPRPDRPAKVAPPEPKRTEPSPAGPVRADEPAKSPPVEPPSAAPAAAAPSPQAASRSNRVEQRTVETAF